MSAHKFADPAQRHLARDPVMAALMGRLGPLPPLLPAPDPFAALLRAVVAQQLSTAAAATIGARLEALAGPEPDGVLRRTPDELRACGLSWAKVRTVRALAEAALGLSPQTQIDFAHLEGLPDEGVIAALVPLPGIGRWTAEMFLIFSLARHDVFSWGDLGLRRGLERFYPGLDHAAVVEAWSPQRTLAARYLWKSHP